MRGSPILNTSRLPSDPHLPSVLQTPIAAAASLHHQCARIAMNRDLDRSRHWRSFLQDATDQLSAAISRAGSIWGSPQNGLSAHLSLPPVGMWVLLRFLSSSRGNCIRPGNHLLCHWRCNQHTLCPALTPSEPTIVAWWSCTVHPVLISCPKEVSTSLDQRGLDILVAGTTYTLDELVVGRMMHPGHTPVRGGGQE